MSMHLLWIIVPTKTKYVKRMKNPNELAKNENGITACITLMRTC